MVDFKNEEQLDKEIDPIEEEEFYFKNVHDPSSVHVEDVIARFDDNFLLSVLSEKITEVSIVLDHIEPNQSIKVNELSFDKDNKVWDLNCSIYQASYN